MNNLSLSRKNDVFQGTILVVDDTPSNLTLLSRILSSRGFRILLADNGLDAIQITLETIPDIILLDINMPEMDGYETCKKLKADNRTNHIPVIFISSLDEIEDKVRAFKVGAADYIPKPIEFEEVLARVNTHLANQLLREQLRNANSDLETKVKELIISREQLQEQDGKLRAFINAIPSLSFVYDDEGRYLEILPNEPELLLANADELQGRLLKDVMPADVAKKILNAIRRAIEKNETQIVEYKIPVIS